MDANGKKANLHLTVGSASHKYLKQMLRENFIARRLKRLLRPMLAIAIVLAGCSKTVKNNYPKRIDAENDRLFARGWLPEIIPRSSNRIITLNDLDLNRSMGEFYFGEVDKKEFLSHLTRTTSKDENGYSAYLYKDGTRQWIFLINDSEQHCRYRFQLDEL